MLHSIRRKLKGQNTAEYALLISLVVAAVIAMQTYAQRALQARVRDASQFMVSGTPEGQVLGSRLQYEPYYLESEYDVTRDSTETIRLDENVVEANEITNRVRADGGFQESDYLGDIQDDQ